MDNAVQASRALPLLLDSLRRGTEAVEQAARGLARASEGANAAVQDGRRSLTRFGQETLPEVTALATELRNLVATMQRFTEQLQRDPNSLLFGRRNRRPGPGE
jgi:phospholipid/cholesterol/gamma-HCH transport system substrate-binding protein